MNKLAAGLSLSVLAFTLAGCVAPPSSPQEMHARRAAGAEIAARQCAGYVGGYTGVKELRATANKNIVTARKLGATDADIAKARTDVATAFNTAVSFTTKQESCNSLVGELAWVDG